MKKPFLILTALALLALLLWLAIGRRDSTKDPASAAATQDLISPKRVAGVATGDGKPLKGSETDEEEAQDRADDAEYVREIQARIAQDQRLFDTPIVFYGAVLDLSDRPEVFRLRKKGEAAELVHLKSIVQLAPGEPERSFSLFDHTRRRDRPEYILLRRVETAERDAQGRPVRRLEMVVPAGGIQQRTDEFQFIAPTGGYQPSMYFMRPPFGGKLDYFVKFDTGNYARFTIMGSAGDYLIDSYLNPDGSPNLEYDREKGITVVPTGRMGIDLLYPPKSDPPPKP